MPQFATPIETMSHLPARLDLEIVRGDPLYLPLQIRYGDPATGYDPNDQTVDISATWCEMVIRKLQGSDPYVLKWWDYIDDPKNGMTGFLIPGTQTELLEPGSYVYDIQVVDWWTILSGSLYIQNENQRRDGT